MFHLGMWRTSRTNENNSRIKLYARSGIERIASIGPDFGIARFNPIDSSQPTVPESSVQAEVTSFEEKKPDVQPVASIAPIQAATTRETTSH